MQPECCGLGAGMLISSPTRAGGRVGGWAFGCRKGALGFGYELAEVLSEIYINIISGN